MEKADISTLEKADISILVLLSVVVRTVLTGGAENAA
jgi:hypothetical protein